MVRLRSITLLTICALALGAFGFDAAPAYADATDPDNQFELPPSAQGETYSVEDDGDPDDYGITFPTDSSFGTEETVRGETWSWDQFIAWLSDVVSFGN